MELRIRNISKRYPNGVQALKGVTLTIPPGVYGLLGPRGSGKSTLTRILATLQEPDEGSVSLGGIDVLKEKEEVRKSLGYLPQELWVQPKINAEKLLDRLVVSHPKLLIVDEPAAGCDAEERDRLMHLFSELGEDSVVLLSTGTVEDVSKLCGRMAIINDGRILLETEPRRAVQDLRGRIWHRVIAKEALPKVEREYSVVSTKILAGQPVVRVFSHTAPAVGFERAEPNLEDVYFSAMKFHWCVKN